MTPAAPQCRPHAAVIGSTVSAMDPNTTDTLETRIFLQGGPLDGDEYRSPKTPVELPPLLHFMAPDPMGLGREPVAYERAMERIYGPNAPLRYVVDDQGRHVYRPHPPLLEDALVVEL